MHGIWQQIHKIPADRQTKQLKIRQNRSSRRSVVSVISFVDLLKRIFLHSLRSLGHAMVNIRQTSYQIINYKKFLGTNVPINHLNQYKVKSIQLGADAQIKQITMVSQEGIELNTNYSNWSFKILRIAHKGLFIMRFVTARSSPYFLLCRSDCGISSFKGNQCWYRAFSAVLIANFTQMDFLLSDHFSCCDNSRACLYETPGPNIILNARLCIASRRSDCSPVSW